MTIVQDVMDSARLDLNDISAVRYPDSELLRYANEGIFLTYSLRPDLKYGSYGTAAPLLVASSTFPLPDEYRHALSSYIVKRNQDGDDAFVLNQRAEQEMAEFIKGLGIG